MELTPVERDILVDLLTNGDNVPANIAENCDRHAKSVSYRLSDLVECSLVRNKGNGVYTLTVEGAQSARALRNPEADTSS